MKVLVHESDVKGKKNIEAIMSLHEDMINNNKAGSDNMMPSGRRA